MERKVSIWKKLFTLKNAVIVLVPLCFFCICVTLFYYTPTTTFAQFVSAITAYDYDEMTHYVLKEIKAPRILGALIVGALLPIGGAVMQGITRNYLASPGTVGVDSGAGLGLAIAMAMTGGATSYVSNVLWSMVGAMISTLVIFYISSQIKGRESGVKLLLAGSAIGSLFSGLASSLNIWSGLGQNIYTWNNSGFLGMQWVGIAVLMVGVVGGIIGISIGDKITVLGMGDETATSLGENVKKIKTWGVISVVLISGTTVCTVGNIGFVGMILPNMVKMGVGEDFKKVIPISAFFGSMFLVITDVISRWINLPAETPIGAVTSVIGIPIFLYFINSRNSKGGY
ncbi:MAG: iron ABC transporter permease [Eubacteriales bacterium]